MTNYCLLFLPFQYSGICLIQITLRKPKCLLTSKTKNCTASSDRDDAMWPSHLGVGIAKFNGDISLQLILKPNSLQKQWITDIFSSTDMISHPIYIELKWLSSKLAKWPLKIFLMYVWCQLHLHHGQPPCRGGGALHRWPKKFLKSGGEELTKSWPNPWEQIATCYQCPCAGFGFTADYGFIAV